MLPKSSFQELEVKKKAEEAAKAKEKELNDSEDKETGSDPELLEVKVRLEKLEEALKEIVVESKKQPDSISTKNQEDGSKRKHVATDHSNTPSNSEARNSATEDRDFFNKHKSDNFPPSLSQGNASGLAAPAPVTDASQNDLRGSKNEGPTKK
ncbi:hypothetical protein Acr_16g0006560 [Actinidia rufa]|uniref:Uncharacterized protein n=1 Tax=Actinidia rufa TaxID=165716 RepID=A0A7J0FZA4_9ERIC|nr:hypothetical protein Acr_16g0006560 [Actinidia rufa]